jgi:putative methyltransferase (TIGR04325 family)
MFKRALKAALPRRIIDAVRERRHETFATWDEAAEASTSYYDDLINDFRIARAKLRTIDGAALRSTRLLDVVEQLSEPDLHIVDFGGATGELARDYLALYPSAQFTIVENPTMVRKMASTIPNAAFSTGIPHSCDIFFTSGTIQYLRDPYGILADGFKSATRAVVLARNSFSDSPIYRAQHSRLYHNGTGPIPAGVDDVEYSYPHQTVIEHRVHEIAERAGFKLADSRKETSGVLPYRGRVYGRDLAFFAS